MRVDPRFSPQIAGPAGAARPASTGTAFALGAAPPDVRTQGGATIQAAALSTADALIALQGGEVADGERRRRSAKRGHEMLDALDRLKAALLGGRVATADLKDIAARLAERVDSSGDPRLDEIVAHIRLRAEVELAKLAVGEGTRG